MFYFKIIHRGGWTSGSNEWIRELCHQWRWQLQAPSVRKWFSGISSCPLWSTILPLSSCCPAPWLSFRMTPTKTKSSAVANPSLPTITLTQSNNHAKSPLDHAALEWLWNVSPSCLTVKDHHQVATLYGSFCWCPEHSTSAWDELPFVQTTKEFRQILP